MSDTAPAPQTAKPTRPIGPDGKPLRPCCVCKEEKSTRDECIVMNGQEKCEDLIEAHKVCMRKLGFNV